MLDNKGRFNRKRLTDPDHFHSELERINSKPITARENLPFIEEFSLAPWLIRETFDV